MAPKFAVYIFLMLTFFMEGCVPAKPAAIAAPEPDYWPTDGWQSSTPEAQGMDSELLAQLLEDISENETSIHSILVIRNGYVVTEAYSHPYTRETKMHIQSVTKSVIGALVGIALHREIISGVDQPLVNFFRNRRVAYLSEEKKAIQLKHLLSMSSGLDCAEFSPSRQSMEQTADWVQFMLDLPVVETPGESFGYCNGNAHLLSAILEETSGVSTREFANQHLFQLLGIPPVDISDWGEDPQGFAIGGYGLHLRPVDLAKFAFLFLHNGKWGDQRILPENWVTDSMTQYVEKGDGSGYGYLWTVYPKSGHSAALGLGGQQIHIYPSKNLIVIMTASLESYAEAPEIEKMLNHYILPAIKSDGSLADNPHSFARFQTRIESAASPVQPVPPLPATAWDISGSTYTLEENPLGWGTLEFVIKEGAKSAQLHLSNFPILEIGLDNIYRRSTGESIGELLLRGRWVDEQTFIIDYPYPANSAPILGELGETEFRFKFTGDNLEVTAEQLVFGGEPIVIKGSR